MPARSASAAPEAAAAVAARPVRCATPRPGGRSRGRWLGAFAPASLETLVDSPLFAGRTPAASNSTHRAPSPGGAEPGGRRAPARSRPRRRRSPRTGPGGAVGQAVRARHWRQYDFLLAISDSSAASAWNTTKAAKTACAGYFKDWDKAIRARELLPHEYVHAWNGKFRRPADLWTPNYNVPMRNSAAVGVRRHDAVLGPCAGRTLGPEQPEQARDRLADERGLAGCAQGRRWRNLQDTTNEGTIASRRDKPWRDWQRGADYYDEATLIWLDADTLIRDKTAGTLAGRLCAAFFGIATSTPCRRRDQAGHVHLRRARGHAERACSRTTGRPSCASGSTATARGPAGRPGTRRLEAGVVETAKAPSPNGRRLGRPQRPRAAGQLSCTRWASHHRRRPARPGGLGQPGVQGRPGAGA
jgi:hypothetical protein